MPNVLIAVDDSARVRQILLFASNVLLEVGEIAATGSDSLVMVD